MSLEAFDPSEAKVWPSLTLVAGPGGVGKQIPLRRAATVIGSRENAGIRLSDSAAVSGAHAVVLVHNNRVVLRDLGSRAGTLVNGEPAVEHVLENGDRVTVGPYEFELHRGDWGDAGNGDAPAARLAWEGGEQGLGADTVVIGRSSRCDVTVPSELASAIHAIVVAFGARRVIFDLDSKNGTYVNGAKVKQARLSPGDRVRIGGTDFRYEDAPEVAAVATPVDAEDEDAPLALDLGEEDDAPIAMESLLTEGDDGVKGEGAEAKDDEAPIPLEVSDDEGAGAIDIESILGEAEPENGSGEEAVAEMGAEEPRDTSEEEPAIPQAVTTADEILPEVREEPEPLPEVELEADSEVAEGVNADRGGGESEDEGSRIPLILDDAPRPDDRAEATAGLQGREAARDLEVELPVVSEELADEVDERLDDIPVADNAAEAIGEDELSEILAEGEAEQEESPEAPPELIEVGAGAAAGAAAEDSEASAEPYFIGGTPLDLGMASVGMVAPRQGTAEIGLAGISPAAADAHLELDAAAEATPQTDSGAADQQPDVEQAGDSDRASAGVAGFAAARPGTDVSERKHEDVFGGKAIDEHDAEAKQPELVTPPRPTWGMFARKKDPGEAGIDVAAARQVVDVFWNLPMPPPNDPVLGTKRGAAPTEGDRKVQESVARAADQTRRPGDEKDEGSERPHSSRGTSRKGEKQEEA